MTPEVVKVRDLVQKAGKKDILSGVSFEAREGEILGIFGVRESGKTSLLHILAGIDRFTSGKVEVLGYDIRKTEKFKKHVGFVTQAPSLFRDMKAGENLDFIAVLKGASKNDVLEVVERLELRPYLNDPVTALEVGLYKRLSLACALLASPKLLLLDDPVAGIDLYSQKLIMEELERFISEGGSCIVGFSNIEFCDRVDKAGWLDKGRLTMLTPRELKEKWSEKIQSIYRRSDKDDS